LAESAGVFALVGTLIEIDQGYFKEGEHILVGITGGSRDPGINLPVPDFTLKGL
jgi:hypothetical protein